MKLYFMLAIGVAVSLKLAGWSRHLVPKYGLRVIWKPSVLGPIRFSLFLRTSDRP
jgi:hypothetical protein